MSYVIVKIHGLSNKPPKDVLARGSERAILEGLRRNCGNTEQKINYRSVYWADVLYPRPLEHDEEPYCAALGEGPLKTYRDGWKDIVAASVLGVGGEILDATKRYLGINKVADKVLEAKLSDLYRYYNEAGIRAELRRRLSDEILSHKGKRIMLIAHSMGSIIAYDALRLIGREAPDFELDHFVTIGSPLGLPHVLNRIYQENHLVRSPTVVRRWTNFADRRDPVALDAHLANDYSANDRGVQVVDNLVINSYVNPQRRPNYHKSYGYLRAPEVSEAIRKFI